MRDVTVRRVRIRIRGLALEGGIGRSLAAHVAAALPTHVASALGERADSRTATLPMLSVRVPQTATADFMASAIGHALGGRLRGHGGIEGK